MSRIRVSVRQEDFSLEEEGRLLREKRGDAGALVTFSGLVRDFDQDSRVSSLFLEHYPGMTEKSLHAICEQALARWSLLDVTVIHRIGELQAGEQIVFVGVSSRHRGEAFAAAEFIMDYLKTRAPFWKKTRDEQGERWVEAKASDEDASRKWQKHEKH